jgi:Skp family chaperone for outer membrane proteins
MRKILLILTCLLATTLALPAQAQMMIAVVDMQQILSESDAAKDILAQLKTHREKLEREVKAIEESLKKDEQALVKAKDTAKPEDFAKSRQAFEKKLVDSRGKVQKQRKEADAAFNQAIGELRGHILTAVTELATEKKIQLVITKQNVVIGDKGLEITGDVMTKLNAKVKTIKVKL